MYISINHFLLIPKNLNKLEDLIWLPERGGKGAAKVGFIEGEKDTRGVVQIHQGKIRVQSPKRGGKGAAKETFKDKTDTRGALPRYQEKVRVRLPEKEKRQRGYSVAHNMTFVSVEFGSCWSDSLQLSTTTALETAIYSFLECYNNHTTQVITQDLHNRCLFPMVILSNSKVRQVQSATRLTTVKFIGIYLTEP